MKEMTPEERLEYLIEKRKWLQSKGMDLRPNRLQELNELLTNSVDGKLSQYVSSSRRKPV